MYFCVTERFNVLNFKGPQTHTFGAAWLSTLWSEMSDFIMCLISGQNILAEQAAAIITQESQDNLFDLSNDGDDDFPVGSGSDIESETEEE